MDTKHLTWAFPNLNTVIGHNMSIRVETAKTCTPLTQKRIREVHYAIQRRRPAVEEDAKHENRHSSSPERNYCLRYKRSK